MAAITRRALLSRTLLGAAVGGGALAGLTRPVSHKMAVPPPSPPEALTSALSRQQALLEGYNRALATSVGSGILTGLRADVSQHGAALRALLERYPGWRLAQAGTATGTVTATLPEAAPVPGSVAGLAAASTSAAKELHAGAMDWGADEAPAAQVVPILASISASLSTHAQVLSARTGAVLTKPAAGPAPRTTPTGAADRATPPGAAATSSPTVLDALQRVLAAEHAAVYGYPVAGVRLSEPGQVRRARELESAHRQVRDDLMAQLTGLGLTPVAAQPAYRAPGIKPAPATRTEPGTRTDPVAAARSAVLLEEGCAVAYRYLLTAAVAGGPRQLAVRTQALSGLVAAAATATTWRTLVTPAKPTVAFPGL